MGIKDITRTATGAYIGAVKWPLSRAAKLIGRGEVVDRADATARTVVGDVTGDQQLKQQGRKKAAAVDQREKAARLRKQAAKTTTQARETATEREEKATARREEAAKKQAAKKKAAAQQKKTTEAKAK